MGHPLYISHTFTSVENAVASNYGERAQSAKVWWEGWAPSPTDIASGPSVTTGLLGVMYLDTNLLDSLPLRCACSLPASWDGMLWQVADVPINNLSGLMDRRGKECPRTYLRCGFLPHFRVPRVGRHTLPPWRAPNCLISVHLSRHAGAALRGWLTCSSPRILKWWSSLIRELGQPAVGERMNHKGVIPILCGNVFLRAVTTSSHQRCQGGRRWPPPPHILTSHTKATPLRKLWPSGPPLWHWEGAAGEPSQALSPSWLWPGLWRALGHNVISP